MRRFVFLILPFFCAFAGFGHTRADPKSATSQTEIINKQSITTDQENIIPESFEEKKQNFWGMTYLSFTAVGLVVAICGLVASYQSLVFSNRVSASQKTQIWQAKVDAGRANQIAAEANERAQQLEFTNLRLQQQMAWRRLTKYQDQRLITELKPFDGQKIKMASVLGDPEGLQYRRDFMGAFEKSRWLFGPNDCTQVAFINPPIGLQVNINPADIPEDNVVLKSAYVLASVLFELKLIPVLEIAKNPEIPKGTILLLIGVKPPIESFDDNQAESPPVAK